MNPTNKLTAESDLRHPHADTSVARALTDAATVPVREAFGESARSRDAENIRRKESGDLRDEAEDAIPLNRTATPLNSKGESSGASMGHRAPGLPGGE